MYPDMSYNRTCLTMLPRRYISLSVKLTGIWAVVILPGNIRGPCCIYAALRGGMRNNVRHLGE